MSGDKPRYPAAPGGHDALKRELDQMGVQYEDTEGHYGEPERSLVVYGLPRDQLRALGKKYGQESVIHSEGGQHRLIYTNGPNEGLQHPSLPQVEVFPEGAPPPDNHTHLPGAGYVRLHFDWDRMEPTDLDDVQPRSVAKAELRSRLLPEEFSHVARHPLGKSESFNTRGSQGMSNELKLTAPQVIQGIHKLGEDLRKKMEEVEAECVALRKAETAALAKVAPPGWSEKTMHKLKAKHGTESAFKIAWAAHNKHGDAKKAEEELTKEGGGSMDGGMGTSPDAPLAMGESRYSDEDVEKYAKGEILSNKGSGKPCMACGNKDGTCDCATVEKYAKGEIKPTYNSQEESKRQREELASRGKMVDVKPAPFKDKDKTKKAEPNTAIDRSGGKGTMPEDADPKKVGAKKGSGDLAKAGAIPTAPAAPGASATPKGPKLPKLPMPKASSVKPPAMGAGTANPVAQKAEAPMAAPKPKVQLPGTKSGPAAQAGQAAKLPGVRAQTGAIMDSMTKPQGFGVGSVLPSNTPSPALAGVGQPKPQPAAPVQTQVERVASRVPHKPLIGAK